MKLNLKQKKSVDSETGEIIEEVSLFEGDSTKIKRGKKMTELTSWTDDNYYSDKTYMSVSRFKEHMKCEARAKAIDDRCLDDERRSKTSTVRQLCS